MANVFTRGDDESGRRSSIPSAPRRRRRTMRRRRTADTVVINRPRRVWRSRALGFTSAFALVLCASYAVDGSFSALRARLTPAERTAMTMREYGDREALGVLRWSSKDGFTAKHAA